jgi:formylglycine-generating enzyme required for sulfatase activity
MKYGILFALPWLIALMATIKPKLPKQLKKNFAFVPAGMAIVGNDTIWLQSFYMMTTEVSNEEFKRYLTYLETKGDKQALESARIRNENWDKFLKSPAFSKAYHTHSAFEKYPVVNVSYLGAQGYCDFRTDELNKLLAKSGLQIKVRLPFHSEIVRAGVGDNYNRLYPWDFDGVRNKKGEFICNHLAETSYKNTSSQVDNTDLLAPVKSYFPSPLGFYNLSGNAAEMTNIPGVAVGGSFLNKAHEVTLQSKLNYEESACNVGFRVVFTWKVE